MPGAAAEDILRVENLSMRFGGLVAVDRLSFAARRGEITALIGPNGAGKTTVFNCVTGFYKPAEGRIAFAPETAAAFGHAEAATASGRRSISSGDGSLFLLERMEGHAIARDARVARTFQNIRLFNGMTVLENLLVAQHNALRAATRWPLAALFRSGKYIRAEASAIALATEWLGETGLRERADDPAGDLPYGDRRRLEIARAMCTEPVLLCLDEPAAGLNPRESASLNELLLKIRGEHALSIVLVEHDMGVVMGISDRIVVLDYGKKIAEGTPYDIRHNPKVIAAYLGEPDGDATSALAEAGA